MGARLATESITMRKSWIESEPSGLGPAPDFHASPGVQVVSGKILHELSRHYLFSSLDPAQIVDIGRGCRRVELEEGATLFSQGEPAAHFYLLTEGRIRLYRLSPDGQEKVIEIVQPHHTFAEAAIFFDQPSYPVFGAALTRSALIAIDADVFLATILTSPDACRSLLGSLSQRLHFLVNQIHDLTLKSATARVAGFLLSRLTGGSAVVELDVPKCVLACQLSVQPETFSRIMRQLADRGLITVTGTRVIVHDRSGLKAMSMPCDYPPGIPT